MAKELSLQTESETMTLSLEDEAYRELESELPLESRTSTWGDEIYFAVPAEFESGEQTMNPQVGDIAFWPEGKALCLFFGPTPLSEGDQPRAADDVVIVGTIQDDPELLRNVEAGEALTLTDHSSTA